MESYTYEQLKHMTVADLRNIAQGLQKDELEGYSTMHKDHLLPLLCKVLNIHIHHAAAGSEKTQMKATIRQLQAERDSLFGKADAAKRLAVIRGRIHSMKRRLRRMADEADKQADKQVDKQADKQAK
jgi:hypothetical protein